MSAVFGMYRTNGAPIQVGSLYAMSEALAHRGPDGAGVWTEGTAGLGHRMLRTTEEALAESQPLVHAPSGLVLVADARIDNRAELSAALGVRLATATDAALILEAYLRWGAESPKHLLGDFAFVIWDPRDQVLFCARDPMGVKPLYYAHVRGLFAFATEIKALHRLPEVSRELDEVQIAVQLAWAQGDREGTVFRDVRRLPAAHSLTVRRDAAPQIRRYWDLDPDPDRPSRRRRPEDYEEEFRETFRDAVRVRLRGVRAIGTTLSGGLDSSSVTCVARDLMSGSTESLHAFSLIFPEFEGEDLRLIDERSYVDSVVRQGDVVWHPVIGSAGSPLGDLDRLLTHIDEPFAAPNLFLHWALYAAAQRSGVGVILDGFDGDSVVSHGLGRLNRLLQADDWRTFEAEVRALAANRGIDPSRVLAHHGLPQLAEQARSRDARRWWRTASELASRFGLSRRELLWNFGLSAAVPASLRSLARLGQRPGQAERTLLRSSLAARLEDDSEQDAGSRVADERTEHVRGISRPGFQSTLEMADKMAAAFGVEPRYPFFDRRLIEFCVTVPEEQKFAGGWTRLLMRRAMEGVLPGEIQWRSSKANLSPAFHQTFRTRDRKRVEAADYRLLDRYLDASAASDIRARYFDDSSRRWGDPDGYLLYRATVLVAWLSRLQCASPASVTGDVL